MFSNRFYLTLRRSGFLALLFVVYTLCIPHLAAASEKYTALANAALTVKSPTKIPLVTIIRVGQRLVAAGVHGVIIFSDDEGKTWHQAAVPVDLTVTALYFTSPKLGWAVGHYGVILSTTDGGTTWQKVIDGLDVISALSKTSSASQQGDPKSPAAQLDLRVANAFRAAGPDKPFLTIGACGAGILAAGQQDMAMFSLDHGATWQEWTSHISNPNFQNIYTILNTGGNTWLVGEGGLLLKSNANCENFSPVAGPYTATLFDGLTFGQKSILLFGLDGGLFQTDNAGSSWETLAMPPDAVIDAGVVLNSGRVLLGTLSGGLYLSNTKVTDFTALPFTEPFQIAAMVLAQNGNIVAVGNGGVKIILEKSIRLNRS